MQDYNEDGMLSFSEFSDLIDAFGNQLATSKVQSSNYSAHYTIVLLFCFGLFSC
jgi:hypothetical protein